MQIRFHTAIDRFSLCLHSPNIKPLCSLPLSRLHTPSSKVNGATPWKAYHTTDWNCWCLAGASLHLSSFLGWSVSFSKSPRRFSVSDPQQPQLRSGGAWSPDHHLGDSSCDVEIALINIVKKRDRQRGDRVAICGESPPAETDGLRPYAGPRLSVWCSLRPGSAEWKKPISSPFSMRDSSEAASRLCECTCRT